MSRLPKIVEMVIDEYKELFNKYIPDTMKGLYLHGSIALNAFEEGGSDIDFIAVTNRRLTENDSDILTKIHRIIAQKYDSPEMDGVYLIREDLERMNDSHQNHFYYNSGSLSFGPYFNFNPVTWTLFAKKGIAILGPASTDFKVKVSTQQLQSYVVMNMNTYWAGRIRWLESSFEELLSFSPKDIQEEIVWTILGLLRQYYTLVEGDIISKTGAGKYGLIHIPKEYHQIIKEAVNARTGGKVSLYNSNKERLESTIAFSNYLIEYGQRFSF